MAITTTSRQTTAFTSGNNFAFGFKVFDTSDVKVIQIDTTTKAETVLTLTSNYTVTLNDDQDANPGGTVTLVSSGNPQNLGSGLNIVITSKVEAKQQTELTNQGGFFPEVINDSLDKAVILLQQQQAVLDKTIKFPLTDSVSGLEVTGNPTDRAKKVLSFDSSGNLDVQQEIGTFKGNWAAGTGYVVRDIVKDTSTNNIFFCNTAHTSSGAQPLTTNANSANWDLIVDAATATTSSTNAASSASAAATSATNAANSATAAATSETNAASSASTATTKATQADTAKTAAETAKTAAETAQTAAETALDAFDDRYLGAKSSDPSTDNDGDALIDGALYFNTTDNVTKVYDSGNSVWRLLKISDANQAKINTVEASIANVNTVGNAIANVNAVAGNATNINNVAGNSSNINTVANNNTNVNTVAGNNANVSTVATDITNVNTVATEINNNNLQTVASNINAVKTAADDLNEATSEIDTVANAITNVDNVGNNISNVNTVAGISSNVTTVANNNSNVTAVAGNASNINSAVSNASNINAAVANQTNINAAVSNATDISAVAANNSNITAVAGNETNINAVKNNETNINAVNANKTNIDAVAGNNSNITAVANNQSNINAVAADASDIGIVAADGTDIGIVAGAIGSVNTTAGSIGNVNTVASNITNVNSFAGTYQIASSDPSTDGAGNSLSLGDLYFNTSISELKVYDGSAWQSGVTNINNFLAKAGGQMTGNITFSGSQTVDGRDVSVDGAKLDTIESNAKDDQTAAEIKTLLNSNGIVNANVDASAAIAGTKISPDCGSQAISTTGTGSSLGRLRISNVNPFIELIDTNNNSDFSIRGSSGNFVIRDDTNAASRLTINSSGTVDVAGNLDVGAGLDVTGNITVSGTVDGVDIAANNTLLGGLTNSNGVLLNGVTASTQGSSDNTTKVATTAYVTTAINNLINGAPGSLDTLNELAAAMADDAAFSTTVTNSLATKLNLSGGQITGNITCSGSQTFDGRDLSVDGTKLDGIAANAIDGSSLNASNLSSGTIPDARFPSVLPAVSAANLTNLPASIGGSTGVDFNDNVKIRSGTGNDLEIFHDGTDSQINSSEGELVIKHTGNGSIKFERQGSVGIKVDGGANFIPFSTNTNLLGSSSKRWSTVYGVAGDFSGTLTTANILSDSDNTRTIGASGNNFVNVFTRRIEGNNSNAITFDTAGNIGAFAKTGAYVEIKGGNNTRGLLVGNTGVIPTHSSVNLGASGDKWNEVHAQYYYGDGSNLTNLPTPTLGTSSSPMSSDIFLADSTMIRFGANQDFRIFHDGSDNTFFSFNGPFKFKNRTLGSGDKGIQIDNSGHLLPLDNNQYTLGNSSYKFSEVHATTYYGDGSNLTGVSSDLVNDTTPSLGGNLNVNGKIIEFGDSSGATDDRLKIGSHDDLQLYHDGTTSIIKDTKGDFDIIGDSIDLKDTSGNKKLETTSTSVDVHTGILGIKNTGTQSEMRLYCESNNAHYASLKAPAHSSFSGNLTYTLPSSYGSNAQVLTTDGSGGTSWTTPASSYTNSSVDTHLNTGSASSSQVLSWNGSDYAWVTQSGGGGGGGSVAGSNTQVQFNNNGSFGGSSNLTFDGTNLSVGGTVSATSSASGTAGMRKITASTSSPSGGSDGDVWIKYT